MIYQEIENGLILNVNKEIYSVDVLHKCFYWYLSEFTINIESNNNGEALITLKAKKEHEIPETAFLIEKIRTDLIDFKVRDIISKETSNIRDLLIAKAFANYDTETAPEGEISDPVGYIPGIQ